jgi:hypothetical protein
MSQSKTLKAFIPDLDKKMKGFGIHPKFFAEMRALVEYGTRPGSELLTRLAHVTNYKACFDSLLAELSQPVVHRFPPIDHFESIEVLP